MFPPPPLSIAHHDSCVCVIQEGAADGTSPFFHALMPLSMEYSMHKNPELRQAALFGIGVCAQYGGAAFTASCMEAVVKLRDVIVAEGSREVDNEHATDNAISSLGKILIFQEKGKDCFASGTVQLTEVKI